MTPFERMDDLLDLIERGQFVVSSHSVAGRILRSLRLNDPLYRTVLDLHGAEGHSADMAEVQKQLWSRIDRSEPGSDGWLRLAVILTRPDETISSELAEYFDYWGRQHGLSEQQVVAAFLSSSSPT